MRRVIQGDQADIAVVSCPVMRPGAGSSRRSKVHRQSTTTSGSVPCSQSRYVRQAKCDTAAEKASTGAHSRCTQAVRAGLLCPGSRTAAATAAATLTRVPPRLCPGSWSTSARRWRCKAGTRSSASLAALGTAASPAPASLRMMCCGYHMCVFWPALTFTVHKHCERSGRLLDHPPLALHLCIRSSCCASARRTQSTAPRALSAHQVTQL